MKQDKKKSKALKIIGGFFLAFFLVCVLGIGTMISIMSSMNKEYSSREVIIGNGEKKALVIYEPSKSGIVKEMSLEMANKIANSGYTVTVNVPSKKLIYSWDEYDIIALGSPVYGGKVSGVLEEYVTQNQTSHKKIIMYCIGSNIEDQEEPAYMRTWIPDTNKTVALKGIKKDKETFYQSIDQLMKEWNQ